MSRSEVHSKPTEVELEFGEDIRDQKKLYLFNAFSPFALREVMFVSLFSNN